MSAEPVHQPVNRSAEKKRSFDTISNRKPRVFTFPQHMLNRNKTRKPRNFSAVSNETIKYRYGEIHTPKGGKRRHRARGLRSVSRKKQ